MGIESLMEYVKPELLVVSTVLYFIGEIIKNSQGIADKYIPMINGLLGIFLCALYIFANTRINDAHEAIAFVFTAIVQGVLVAGLSTYVDQIIKQTGKDD